MNSNVLAPVSERTSTKFHCPITENDLPVTSQISDLKFIILQVRVPNDLRIGNDPKHNPKIYAWKLESLFA
jgi:hypothetical protein